MGKVKFTPPQRVVIEAFKKEPSLSKDFYFTGGTALSVFYLGHRESEDLDFFSEESFSAPLIVATMERWSKAHKFSFEISQVEKVLIFIVKFKDGERTRVDFSHYPYKRLRRGLLVDTLTVDSLTDIAVNKLLLVNQRMNVKDFVDLYFLLNLKTPRFSFWDLIEGVKKKFGFEIDPILVAADFMKVEEFDFLPKMIKPLEIAALQDYFKEKAREIMAGLTE